MKTEDQKNEEEKNEDQSKMKKVDFTSEVKDMMEGQEKMEEEKIGISDEMNEQYSHLEGQKGTPT